MAEDSIRHILRQVVQAAERAAATDNLSETDRATFTAFVEEVGRTAAQFDRATAPDKAKLFQSLQGLHRRCTGPLARFRGFLEDALSAADTVTRPAP